MPSILVVGDSCIDEYQYCTTSRLAPEAPVPVVEVIRADITEGMAANVERNLMRLGSEVQLVTNSSWREFRKTRIVDARSNHMFLRVDQVGRPNRINIETIHTWTQADAIIVSDYDKGFLEREDIEAICAMHPLVFLDTKKPLDDWANQAAYIKINEFEYQHSSMWSKSHLLDKTIRTLGGDGCEFRGQLFPAKRVQVIDVSGAGDTFLASLVHRFMYSKDIVVSIEFANHCAGQVVQSIGMSLPPTLGELPSSN